MDEIVYLLLHVSRYFDLQFSRSDIKSAWSGLRPLVSDPGKADTAKLSRDHVLEKSSSGLLTIAGGKWTTYRKMACDTVDYAVKEFDLRQKSGCSTDRMPLIGGAGFRPDEGLRLAEDHGMDPSITEHLNRAYGDQARSVIAIGKEGLGETLVKGYPYLEAEVLWAARHEMACRAMDVLARRTPLALLDRLAAGSAAERTIDIMAKELGWDSGRCMEEEQLVQERLAVAV